jgi:DNA-binding LacI/PurR family transcriptional regulator
MGAASTSMRETIAVVIPLGHELTQSLSDPFFSEMMGHLAETITQRNFGMLVLKVVPQKKDWLASLIASERVDGIVVLGQSTEQSVLQEAGRNYAPLVVWGGMPGQSYCCVGSDNTGGGRSAVEHLLSLGRRKIAFVGDKSLPEFKLRYEGYCAALMAVDGTSAPRAVYSHLDSRSSRDTIRAAIADPREFDALFAGSDVIALSALQALATAGIAVPKDVSVVGFDNIAAAGSSVPSLTTVKQDLRAGAHALIELLFNRLNGAPCRSVLLPTRLIIRQSCGASTVSAPTVQPT